MLTLGISHCTQCQYLWSRPCKKNSPPQPPALSSATAVRGGRGGDSTSPHAKGWLGSSSGNHVVGNQAQGAPVTFLTTWPIWLSAIVVLGVPTVVAMTGTLVVRRSVTLDKLKTNNEVAGFTFATVGVLYAVLLANGGKLKARALIVSLELVQGDAAADHQ